MTKNEKVELMLDIERWKIREFQDADDELLGDEYYEASGMSKYSD